jgi:hypothetical protein
MRIIGWLAALVAALVAAGSGLAAIIALSPIALAICLLALILFFVAVGASRRRPAVPAVPYRPEVIATPRARAVSDQKKLRRSAAKLGVELAPAPERPADLNEEAAKDALRAIISKRAAG